MKVFVSADLEGIGGVVSWNDTIADRPGYAQACRWMTAEVAAACDVALDAGAERVVVADSHLHRQNLDLDALPAAVEVVRAGPRALGMVHGVHEDAFDVVLCIGFHTGAHEDGLLNHTCNGAGFHEIRLDGVPADELDIYARVAGLHGAPIGLVTGDRAICESAAARFPHIETAIVKEHGARMSGRVLTPAASRSLIAQKTAAALARVDELPVAAGDAPVDLEVEFSWHHPADALELLPIFERRGPSTIGYAAADMAAVSAALEFLSTYVLVPYP
ncbi:MAG: M55 family metallopeptidase [Actinomycetota bacterium]